MAASELGVPFVYSERFVESQPRAVTYRIPRGLRAAVDGKRVAIVDDVINAGSAVCGTLADLTACGATTAAVGALLTLGHSAVRFAVDNQLALETLASLPNAIWEPAECPLCARNTPLER